MKERSISIAALVISVLAAFSSAFFAYQANQASKTANRIDEQMLQIAIMATHADVAAVQGTGVDGKYLYGCRSDSSDEYSLYSMVYPSILFSNYGSRVGYLEDLKAWGGGTSWTAQFVENGKVVDLPLEIQPDIARRVRVVLSSRFSDSNETVVRERFSELFATGEIMLEFDFRNGERVQWSVTTYPSAPPLEFTSDCAELELPPPDW